MENQSSATAFREPIDLAEYAPAVLANFISISYATSFTDPCHENQRTDRVQALAMIFLKGHQAFQRRPHEELLDLAQVVYTRTPKLESDDEDAPAGLMQNLLNELQAEYKAFVWHFAQT